MDQEPTCAYCGKPASELEEYQDLAKDEGYDSPAEAVRNEEGTYNRESNRFACTACYIKIGMPSLPHPQQWKAP
jgi:hypothetical protein